VTGFGKDNCKVDNIMPFKEEGAVPKPAPYLINKKV
jgi:hypothetical protein